MTLCCSEEKEWRSECIILFTGVASWLCWNWCVWATFFFFWAINPQDGQVWEFRLSPVVIAVWLSAPGVNLKIKEANWCIFFSHVNHSSDSESSLGRVNCCYRGISVMSVKRLWHLSCLSVNALACGEEQNRPDDLPQDSTTTTTHSWNELINKICAGQLEDLFAAVAFWI